MKRKPRATPEATKSMASAQAEFLQEWKAEQEHSIAQAREAISAASLMLDNVEEALKELV